MRSSWSRLWRRATKTCWCERTAAQHSIAQHTPHRSAARLHTCISHSMWCCDHVGSCLCVTLCLADVARGLPHLHRSRTRTTCCETWCRGRCLLPRSCRPSRTTTTSCGAQWRQVGCQVPHAPLGASPGPALTSVCGPVPQSAVVVLAMSRRCTSRQVVRHHSQLHGLRRAAPAQDRPHRVHHHLEPGAPAGLAVESQQVQAARPHPRCAAAGRAHSAILARRAAQAGPRRAGDALVRACMPRCKRDAGCARGGLWVWRAVLAGAALTCWRVHRPSEYKLVLWLRQVTASYVPRLRRARWVAYPGAGSTILTSACGDGGAVAKTCVPVVLVKPPAARCTTPAACRSRYGRHARSSARTRWVGGD